MVEISRLQEVAKEFYQLISPYEMDLRDKWKTEGLEEGRTEGRAEGIAEGRAQGRAEGIAQGRAEGRAEGIFQTARNFKKMGLPLEQIAEATGLALDEVNAL